MPSSLNAPSHDVLVVMARAPAGPSHAIKTRLSAAIPDASQRVALYLALLTDTLSAARALRGVAVRVAYVPEGGLSGFETLGLDAADLFPQRGDDLGARQRHVFEDAFARGARRVVVIGSDLGGLAPAHLAEAFTVLRTTAEAVVLGPAEDGGFYLIGLARAGLDGRGRSTSRGDVPDVFSGVRWSTPETLADVVAAARRARRPVVLVHAWFDVDDEAGLRRLRGLVGDPRFAARAPATTAWFERTDAGRPDSAG